MSASAADTKARATKVATARVRKETSPSTRVRAGSCNLAQWSSNLDRSRADGRGFSPGLAGLVHSIDARGVAVVHMAISAAGAAAAVSHDNNSAPEVPAVAARKRRTRAAGLSDPDMVRRLRLGCRRRWFLNFALLLVGLQRRCREQSCDHREQGQSRPRN